jgi:N-acylneuraminate cytidylyltransferase
MKKLKNIAIIPARGGSKRIPRKNIKDFLGKPIIAYSIETALESNLFEEVVVSTDDDEIEKIAIQYGATVLKRSQKNADDFATLADVIEEVKLEFVKKNKEYNTICCLLATAPLISSSLLEQGYTMLLESKADSVRPVVKFSYPIQRALKMEEGKVSFMNEHFAKTRSQDLEPAFFDAGMFYWMQFECGLNGTNRFAFEISELKTQDIDTPEDWRMAELKYKLINS